MTRKVTLIPGDGISGELMEQVIEVLRRAGADVEFERHTAGELAYETTGETIPEVTLESIRRNKVALKGKLRSRASDAYRNPNWQLRKKLDLFATVLPIRNVPGLPARHQDVDLVIIRQATEDIYAGLEHAVRDGVVASLKVVTADESRRITRFAFEYARSRSRKKVTLVHKANIMKVTDGLFIEVAEQVARGYSDIEFAKIIVDNASMQLLLRPHQFDVLLMGNLYGCIMSDLGAGIVGGISATAGASFGDDIAVFESVHGDAPHLEGTGRANPLPLLMPACTMLEHIDQRPAATRVFSAICRTLAAGVTTSDLGGRASSDEVMEAITSAL